MSNSQDDSRRSRQPRRKRRSGRTPRDPITLPMSSGGKHELDIQLAEAEYIVFDIETTGGNPERNGITEICAIRYRGGEQLGRFYSLVNPLIPIPPIVRKMTGISNKTVQDAPLIESVMPEFLEFAKRGILVSHNTIGDLKFIRYYALSTAKHDFDNYFLCTHLLVDKLFPEAPDKSLNGLGKFFGIESGNLHRADADADLTLQVFARLKGELDKRGFSLVSEAVRFQGDYESAVRLGWGIDSYKVDQLPDKPGVIQLVDRNGRDTFVASANSIRREARRLSELSQVPRGLLRSIIQSHNVESHLTLTQFEALMLEAEVLERTKLKIDPAIWHQKNLLTLNLVKDPKSGSVRALISSVAEGSIAIFGPVRDRKAAQLFIDELAERLGFENSRKGMQIPDYAIEPLIAFFSNNLKSWLSGGERKSWFDKVRKMFHRVDPRSRVIAEKLLAVEPPRRIQALHQLKGVVILFEDSGDRALAMASGSPLGKAKSLEQRWSEPFPTEQVADLVARLKRHQIPSAGLQPLSASDAVRFNSFLWWIYSGSNRREGVFLPSDV